MMPRDGATQRALAHGERRRRQSSLLLSQPGGQGLQCFAVLQGWEKRSAQCAMWSGRERQYVTGQRASEAELRCGQHTGRQPQLVR